MATANTLSLQAVLAAVQSLRYTPAGVAMVDAVLSHQSVQREAGCDRQVELEISARFADRAAERVAQVAPGSLLQLSGYLAQRRRGSKALLFHVTDFQIDSSKRPVAVLRG